MKPAPMRSQSGHVLTTSLIILVVLALLGAHLFTGGWLESRMAGSWRKDVRARQLLDLALDHVDSRILPTIDRRDPGPWRIEIDPGSITAGFGVTDDAPALRVQIQRLNWQGASVVGLGTGAVMESLRPSRYRIEIMAANRYAPGPHGVLAIAGMTPGVAP